MQPGTTQDLTTRTGSVRAAVEAHLEEAGGLFRLAPCGVPCSFLQPGKRLKLNPDAPAMGAYKNA